MTKKKSALRPYAVGFLFGIVATIAFQHFDGWRYVTSGGERAKVGVSDRIEDVGEKAAKSGVKAKEAIAAAGEDAKGSVVEAGESASDKAGEWVDENLKN